MNHIKQEKNALLHLIDEVRKKRGLKVTELDKLAGIPSGKSSQLISGKKRKGLNVKTPLESFSIENMYKVLVALDLLKTGKESASKHTFSSKVVEYFDIAKHIEWINKAVDAEDYDRAIEKMESCVNDAKYILKEKLEKAKKENSKEGDMSSAVPFKSKKIK